jgi:hypothetical protein
LSTALIIVGGDNGEFVLSELVFFHVGMPLISCHFSNLNFFDNLVYFTYFMFLPVVARAATMSITSVMTGKGRGVQDCWHSPVCAA